MSTMRGKRDDSGNPIKTPEQMEEDTYCDSSPIGEKWPICNLQNGHKGMHQSADFQWVTGGMVELRKV